MSDAKHRIETTVFYMAKEYKFKAEELESQITTLSQKGITELSSQRCSTMAASGQNSYLSRDVKDPTPGSPGHTGTSEVYF